MKTLLLIRHAKSSWKHPELRDFERPLNKRGKRDAPFMGSILKKRGIRPDGILTSPAERALWTARRFADALGYPRESIIEVPGIYEGGPGSIEASLRSIDDSEETILLFCHNPDITELAERFTGVEVGNVPTSGVVCILFDINTWANVGDGRGKLVFFDIPKNYPDRRIT